LGHIIGSSGVKIGPEKTKSVREWSTPKSLAEVRSFLVPTISRKSGSEGTLAICLTTQVACPRLRLPIVSFLSSAKKEQE